MSDVFDRQRGLVDQTKLSKLVIRFVEEIISYQFIESFELIGQQLGVKQFSDSQTAIPTDSQEYCINWSDSEKQGISIIQIK